MKLQKLTLHNFKGVKELVIEPNGEDVAIYGNNGTGKTTIADSLFWLFFDKDSLGRKKFDIKTIDETGQTIPKLDHSVEGVFGVGETVITLKKTYYEKWTKKRGDTYKTFDGHVTQYHIDGVPKAKGKFLEKVKAVVASEEQFKLLTSPHYFCSLPWKDQRDMLLLVCGDISDADIIASNSELSELIGLMGNNTLDEFREMIVAQRRDVNKQLKSIPGRVDEATRAIPDLTVKNAGPIVEKLKSLGNDLERQKDHVASIKAGGSSQDIKTAIAAKKADIARQAVEFYNSNVDETPAKLAKKQEELHDIFTDKAHKIKKTEQSIQDNKLLEEVQQDLLTKLTDDWIETDKVKYVGDDLCPTCAKPFDDDEIEATVGMFNQRKADKLVKIEEAGDEAKKKLEATKRELLVLQNVLDVTTKELQPVRDELDGTEAAIKELRNAKPVSFEDTDLCKALTVEVEVLEGELETTLADKSTILNEAYDLQHKIEAEMKKNNDIITAINLAQKQRDRIKELEAQEESLSAEYEKYESYINMIETFEKLKAETLEESINEKFSLIRFKLFDVQINTGIYPTCEATLNGVPYSSVNSAGQVQAGLDIIKTLSEHYNFYPPIVIDGRESITSLPEMKAQIISMIVSSADSSLRINIGGN